MELLNTAATSTAIVPMAKQTRASGIARGCPGAANHRPTEATKRMAPQAAIHGFFGPAASAMAPSTGDRNASASPASAVA